MSKGNKPRKDDKANMKPKKKVESKPDIGLSKGLFSEGKQASLADVFNK